VALGAACGGRQEVASTVPVADSELVVAAFERAVLEGEPAYAELFDFARVGAYEKLLHQYDLQGRGGIALSDAQRAQYEREKADPVAYPVARERRNLGHFHGLFVKQTIGGGGCAPTEARTPYSRLLGEEFPRLPAGWEAWEPLRQEVNAFVRESRQVTLQCEKGNGNRIVLVYAPAANDRGWNIVTMYEETE
jgi:hypothetical protein